MYNRFQTTGPQFMYKRIGFTQLICPHNTHILGCYGSYIGYSEQHNHNTTQSFVMVSMHSSEYQCNIPLPKTKEHRSVTTLLSAKMWLRIKCQSSSEFFFYNVAIVISVPAYKKSVFMKSAFVLLECCCCYFQNPQTMFCQCVYFIQNFLTSMHPFDSLF